MNRQLWNIWPSCQRAAAALTGAVLITGCAGPLPRDFDIQRTAIMVDPAPTELKVNLSSNSRQGTGVGALSGLGGGVLAATPVCATTGPFFPFCLVALTSITTGVGALAGAAAGAQMTEHSATVGAKAAFISALSSKQYSTLLVKEVKAQADQSGVEIPFASEHTSIDLPGDANPSGPLIAAPWVLDVALLSIETEGKERFEFEMNARLRIRRAATDVIVFERHYSENSEVHRTLAEWSADDSAATAVEMTALIRTIAGQMFNDLRTAPMGSPR